jgi:hypothetical protein
MKDIKKIESTEQLLRALNNCAKVNHLAIPIGYTVKRLFLEEFGLTYVIENGWSLDSRVIKIYKDVEYYTSRGLPIPETKEERLLIAGEPGESFKQIISRISVTDEMRSTVPKTDNNAYSKIEITKDNYKKYIHKMCRELDQLGNFINRAYDNADFGAIMKTQKEMSECNEFLGKLLEFQRLNG